MTDEGFEEWDADFLDQLIQVEELALSCTNPTQSHPPPIPAPPPPPHPAPPYNATSYSPPRELSQRVKDNNKGFDQSLNGIGHSAVSSVPHARRSQNVKESEIDILKKELGRVSKQLTYLEEECLELRKERDKKEEQLKSVFSLIETKDAEVHRTKSKNLEYGVPIKDHFGINVNFSNDQGGSRTNVGTSTSKAVRVQTDKAVECTPFTVKNDLAYPRRCPNKLLSVWDTPTSQRLGRDLVSKLFMACEADFHVLFGCLCLSLSSKTTMDSLADKSFSDVALQDHVLPAHSVEAAKVSHLYSMLTKIGDGMVNLEALVEALVDLCGIENVVIVYRSLCVLRVVLNHLFNWERIADRSRRENIIVEGTSSGENTTDIYGSECAESGCLFCANTNKKSDSGLIPFEMRLFNAEFLYKKEYRNHGSRVSIPCVDWVSLFELMHRIAMRFNKEHAWTCAGVSKCSQWLRKEAGLCVQKQAVHLLYLLLNCPKLMAMFCSGCKEEGECAGAANNDAKNASTFQGFSDILEGLADCVACIGKGTQELKLRRNAIIVLAFLASSGKSGFEILLGHRLPERTNFLALILRMLISEMDVEGSETAQAPDIFKGRTLLIREALILLNRLVSSPQYSTPVLRGLTNSRDVASLLIDIANRLCCKGKWLWQSDSMTRQIRESEIVDLVKYLKKEFSSFWEIAYHEILHTVALIIF